MEAVTPLDGLVERLGRQEALSDGDARTILETPDLIAVGMLADEVRRRVHGTRTTFVRVVDVHVDAPLRRLPRGTQTGEVRIIGRPAHEEHAIAAVRDAAAIAGGVPVTGFSLPDLVELAPSLAALTRLCRRLHDAGLAAIADVPLDLTPDPAAPIAAARSAGLAVLRLTVNSLNDEGRIETAMRACELQQSPGGFRAFSPLPLTTSIALPTTGYDDVKQVALARLMVSGIESIQVDWRIYGPKLAQVALTMGADDVDGIAAVEEGVLGTRRSAIEEIRSNIRAAALEPVERDALFHARS